MLIPKLKLLFSCVLFTFILIADAKDLRVRVRGPDLTNKNVRFRIRRVNTTTITPVVRIGGLASSTVSDVCGLSAIKLIQGGENAEPGEFPWLGALFIDNPTYKRYLCTVNLLTTKHLITAAHCMSLSPNVKDYHIILGFLTPKPHIKMTISKMELHPSYVKSGAEHDIVILSLDSPLTFSASLRPICLGSSALKSNNRGTVAGFGPDYSTYRKVTMPLVEMSRCHDSNELFRVVVTEYTFCAGNRNNMGPCKGDSGAGYMQYSNERLFLRGVVSLSLQNNGTCNLRQYIVFADVLRHTDWIKGKLEGMLS